MVITKPSHVQGVKAAADRVCRVHESLTEFIAPGKTLAEIDAHVADTLVRLNSRSCFLRYRVPGLGPFPSHSCLSLNECVVHGTHLDVLRPLEAGDVISIDIGVLHNGWIGDAAWTYGLVEVSDTARRLMDVGIDSLRRGIEAMQPGRPLIDWARAVQQCVEKEAGFFTDPRPRRPRIRQEITRPPPLSPTSYRRLPMSGRTPSASSNLGCYLRSSQCSRPGITTRPRSPGLGPFIPLMVR